MGCIKTFLAFVLVLIASSMIILYAQYRRSENWSAMVSLISSERSADQTAGNALSDFDHEIIDRSPISKIDIDILLGNAVYKQLQAIPIENLKNPIVKRKVEYLQNVEYTYSLPNHLNAWLHKILPMHKSRQIKEKLYPVSIEPHDIDTEFSNLNRVKELAAKTKNESDLKFYWTEIRKEFHLDPYLALINASMEANSNFIDHTSIRYAPYKVDNFLDRLEEAVTDLKPLYIQLHAFIRHTLTQKYGKSINMPQRGLIPEHILQQYLYQVSHSLSSPEHDALYPYPSQKHFVNRITNNMINLDYTLQNIQSRCDDIYTSFGLQDVSILELKDHLSDKHFVTEWCQMDDCFGRPSPEVNFESYIQQCYIQSSSRLNKQQTSTGFEAIIDEPNEEFYESFGNLAKLTLLSPDIMQSLRLQSEANEQININRLFYMASNTLLKIMYSFVNEKWLNNIVETNYVDLLLGGRTRVEMNSQLWSLHQQYTGIGHPNGIADDATFDLSPEDALKIVEVWKPRTIEAVKEILGYQMFRKLCNETGSWPLNECVLYGKEYSFGPLLKSITQERLRNWEAIVEEVTGDKFLNVTPILDYYEPLRKWLTNYNRKHNIAVGWPDI